MLLWGWMLVGSLTMLVGLALSELNSSYTVSSGIYFWSFMLAGRYGPFASWMNGWTNLLGQVRAC